MSSRSADTMMDVTAKLQELARTAPSPAPVISVYLDTRWSDEHQRERVRVFLKNETHKAAAMAAGQLEAELDWITRQGERLVTQELDPEHAGTAMFAGGAAGLRDTLRLAVPSPTPSWWPTCRSCGRSSPRSARRREPRCSS